MQLSLLDAPLARRSDPVTSHRAAEKVDTFKASHEASIYAAICDAGERGATYREIASMTGMEPVAVGRRIKAMRDRKLIEHRHDAAGEIYTRDGMALLFANRVGRAA